MKKEPVMIAAGVPAVFTLAYSFYKTLGLPTFTTEQEAAFWPLVAAILPLVSGWWARSRVSPVK